MGYTITRDERRARDHKKRLQCYLESLCPFTVDDQIELKRLYSLVFVTENKGTCNSEHMDISSEQ